MFPNLFQLVQSMEPVEKKQRVDFAKFFFVRYDEDIRWPLRILWTDKAHFTFTVNVSSKNCVHWAEENPRYQKKIIDVVSVKLYTIDTSLFDDESQGHPFWVITSSKMSHPVIRKGVSSQVPSIKQCWRIT